MAVSLNAGRSEGVIQDEHAQDADDAVGKLAVVVQDAATRLCQVSLLCFSACCVITAVLVGEIMRSVVCPFISPAIYTAAFELTDL